MRDLVDSLLSEPTPAVGKYLEEQLKMQEKYPFDYNIQNFRSGVDTYIRETEERRQNALGGTLTLFPRDLSIHDQEIQGVKVRIYKKTSTEGKLLPVILYFTGSAYAYSNLDWQAQNCRDLAKITGFLVVNIQERVAPEHPYPAGFEDSFKVLQWINQYGQEISADPENIILSGFSSGGGLAAALARKARVENISIKYQLLVSPWLHLGEKNIPDELFTPNYGLQRKPLNWFAQNYATNESAEKDPNVSPLILPVEDMKGLPPTSIFVGGCEVFREQAREYARKLDEAGVAVEFKIYEGLTHAAMGEPVRWGLVTPETDAFRQGALNIRKAIASNENQVFEAEQQACGF
jgi:acetyl esterase